MAISKEKVDEILEEFGFFGGFSKDTMSEISPLKGQKALKSNLRFNEDMAYGGSPRSLETVKKEDLVRVCPDCKSKDIDYANEEFYCKKCGLVLD